MSEVKQKKSGGFFKGFITSIFLITIIVGSAYVADQMYGYNIFQKVFGTSTGTTGTNINTDSTMNMGNGNMNMSGSTDTTSAQIGKNYALQNADRTDKIISLVDDALKSLTLDPYAADASNSMTDQKTTTDNSGQATVQNPANGTQGNTIVNVYPANGSNNTNTQTNTNGTMANMGTTYDVNKMEQLHKGLYKVSIGIQLLTQLKDDLNAQAGQAVYDANNPTQYYVNQYNVAILNKSSLSKAADYINAAGDLMNVNPYVNANGLVYDKDRMQQVHKGIFTMAEAVADLDKLSKELTKQSVEFSTLAQNSYNNLNMNMNMNTTTSTGNLFGNLSIQSIGNILLILFISAFVIGLLGFIFSLTKPKKKYVQPTAPEKTKL